MMNELGIYPSNTSAKVKIDPSVMLILEHLKIKKGPDGIGRPGILVDPRCEKLIEAFDGTFVTDEDDPDKYSGGLTEHEVDCLRYAMSGSFPTLG
jgi:hypothetical protein